MRAFKVSTNTPLQALALLNEVSYVEAARNLAQQMMLTEKSPAARLRWGWRQVTSREPSDYEVSVLANSLQRNLKRYAADSDAAKELVSFGESIPAADLDVSELAAYTAVASMLMNLDEVINGEWDTMESNNLMNRVSSQRLGGYIIGVIFSWGEVFRLLPRQ